jgi:hypothetical protein
MKWRIESANTGIDFGTYDADNEDGAMEAMAQDIANESKVDVQRVRNEIALGRYRVTRVE